MLSRTNRSLTGVDIYAVYKHYRKWIWITSCLCTITLVSFISMRPPQYTVSALFKDEGLSQNSKDMGMLRQIIGMQSSGDSKASVMFFSRKIIEPLIHDLALQVFGDEELSLHHFSYHGKSPIEDRLTVKEGSYHLEKLDQLVEVEKLLSKPEYKVKILPLEETLKWIRRRLVIKPSEQDQRVLYISFTHPHPEKGALFVNRLMESYRQYLTEENEKIFGEQMLFLQKRKGEVLNEIHGTLNQYANTLQQEGLRESFLPFDEWMKHQAALQQRLSDSILQARLEKEALLSTLLDIPSVQWLDSPIRGELSLLCKERQILLGQENLIRENLLPQFSSKIQFVSQKWQKNAQDDFLAPFDEVTAKEWLLSYQKKEEELTQLIQKYRYLMKKIEESVHFIPSMQSILPSFALSQIVGETSLIIQRLDRASLIPERERLLLQEELSFKQKTILDHLHHLEKLAEIDQQQYQMSSYALKQHYLEQIERKRGEIDKQLSLQIEKRIQMLDDKIERIEKEVVEGERVIQKILPGKWTQEQSTNTQIALNVQMLKSVIENVEAKNVSHLLMQVMAKPIDEAIPPKKRDLLYLPAITILSFWMSFILSMALFFAYSLRRGMPIHSLSFFPNGQPTLSLKKDEAKAALLLKKVNLFFGDFGLKIAKNVSEQGSKVVIIEIEKSDQVVLLPSLQELDSLGSTWKLPIKGVLLLEAQEEMRKILSHLKARYDRIFIILPFDPREITTQPWALLADQVFWPCLGLIEKGEMEVEPHHVLIL